MRGSQYTNGTNGGRGYLWLKLGDYEPPEPTGGSVGQRDFHGPAVAYGKSLFLLSARPN